MSVKVTVRIPRVLKERMDRLAHINWSEIVRRTIEEKAREEEVKRALEVMEEISSKAKPERPTAEIIREFRDRRCPKA